MILRRNENILLEINDDLLRYIHGKFVPLHLLIGIFYVCYPQSVMIVDD